MNVVDHKCLSCGSPLNFDITSQKWICHYCKTIYSLQDLSSNIEKYDRTQISKFDVYACNNCGAKVLGDDTVSSTRCPYCGNSVIIKSKLTGNYKPDAIITFKHSKEEIIDIFVKDLKSKYFSDRQFNDSSNIKLVSQIYVPYWLVTCEAMASVKGLSAATDDNKASKICSRLGAMRFDRVPADAKRNLNNELLQGVEPFNYDELVKFEYPYLAGMFAECYDDNEEEVIKNQIKQRIEEAAEEKLIKTFFTRNGTVYERNTFINKPLFEYVLVPIWLVQMEYQGKKYEFCINDQTKKIAGKRQLNKTKLTLFSILIMLFIIILCLIYINFRKMIGDDLEAAKMGTIYIFFAGALLETLFINHINAKYTKFKKGKKSSSYIEEGSFYLISSSNEDSY